MTERKSLFIWPILSPSPAFLVFFPAAISLVAFSYTQVEPSRQGIIPGLWITITFALLFIPILKIIFNLTSFSLLKIKLIIAILFLLSLASYPAFLSHDIFNYVFDAKILIHYQKLPWFYAPEYFRSDPLFKSVHWPDSPSRYGPVWLLPTSFAYLISLNDLASLWLVRTVGMLGYLGCLWIVNKIAGTLNIDGKKALTFLILNPYFIVEGLFSPHTDTVMSFFALLAIYFLLKKESAKSLLTFLLSIGTKIVSFPLILLFPLVHWLDRVHVSHDSQKTILISALILSFLGSAIISIRWSINPWYFTLPLIISSLFLENKPIRYLAISLSVALPLRYLPYFYIGFFDPNNKIRLYIFLLAMMPFMLWLAYRFQGKFLPRFPLIILTPLLIHLFLSVTTLFTYWPEMLNWPFFLSRGWLPYRDFTIVHTPLLPIALLAFYKLLGFNPITLHVVGTLLLVLSNISLVVLVRRLSKNNWLAFLSGTLFAFTSISYEGNHVWFDSLLTPLFLITFWLEIRFLETKRNIFFVLAGIFAGLAILTKQTAIYGLSSFTFIPVYLFLKKNPWREIIKSTFAFITPIILSISIFLFSLRLFGVLPDFINWGVKFPIIITHLHGVNLSPDFYFPTLREINKLIMFVVLVVLVVLKKPSWPSFFALTWAFFSALILYPRFGYFHLESSIAFLFIAAAISLSKFPRKFTPVISLAFAAAVTATSIPVLQHHLSTGQTFLEPEVYEISNWIKNNCAKCSVYSLNSPQSVYFLSGKLPGIKPWVDQLSWNMAFLGPKYLAAFKKSPPDIVIFRDYKPEDYQPQDVVNYFLSHYFLIKTFPSETKIYQRG